jgi:hypothetical protein
LKIKVLHVIPGNAGAGLLAMAVNDNAGEPDKCGVFEAIAGR